MLRRSWLISRLTLVEAANNSGGKEQRKSLIWAVINRLASYTAKGIAGDENTKDGLNCILKRKEVQSRDCANVVTWVCPTIDKETQMWQPTRVRGEETRITNGEWLVHRCVCEVGQLKNNQTQQLTRSGIAECGAAGNHFIR